METHTTPSTTQEMTKNQEQVSQLSPTNLLRSVFLQSQQDCACVLKHPKQKIFMICAYAPTLPNSEKNPEIHDNFYNELESLIKTIPNRHTLILAGDFNAQTGSAYHRYRDTMGRFGKGKVNSNGEELLAFAQRNDLVLTNTLFQHKLSHITTWESPYRKLVYKDGTIRKHPFRNQIDYILIRKKDRKVIRNS